MGGVEESSPEKYRRSAARQSLVPVRCGRVAASVNSLGQLSGLIPGHLWVPFFRRKDAVPSYGTTAFRKWEFREGKWKLAQLAEIGLLSVVVRR